MSAVFRLGGYGTLLVGFAFSLLGAYAPGNSYQMTVLGLLILVLSYVAELAEQGRAAKPPVGPDYPDEITPAQLEQIQRAADRAGKPDLHPLGEPGW